MGFKKAICKSCNHDLGNIRGNNTLLKTGHMKGKYKNIKNEEKVSNALYPHFQMINWKQHMHIYTIVVKVARNRKSNYRKIGHNEYGGDQYTNWWATDTVDMLHSESANGVKYHQVFIHLQTRKVITYAMRAKYN